MSDCEEFIVAPVEELEQKIVEEEPVTVDEPVVTIEEEHVVTVDEPVVTVDEPVVTFDEPVAVEEPAVTIEEEPAVTIEEQPAAVTVEEQPVVVTVEEQHVAVTVEEQPAVTIEEEPAVTIEEEPAVTIEEQPVVVTVEEQPVVVTVDEPAATIEEEPVATVEEPAVTIEVEPAVTFDEPVATIEEEPAVTIEEEPVVTVDEPAAVTVEEEPAVTIEEEPAATIEEEPVATVEEPAVTIEVEPAVTIEEEPVATIEVEPVAVTIEENITLSIDEVSSGPIVPKLIFIIPYRDRKEQQKFFNFQMEKVLEDCPKEEYMMVYSHQLDQRSFNRGAMKNIGFLYAKSLFPNDYQNITFVFNDVDTMPYTKGFLNYDTTPGSVKHFYGYTFTLGGIVSIKGADFEKTNGFPNYWAWGYEDNAFQQRVKNAGLIIDRSQFYPIMDKNILQLKDGITRVVNRGEFDRYADEVKYQNNSDGISSIFDVSYLYDQPTNFLHVRYFQTPIVENVELAKVHDMRQGAIPFQSNNIQRRGRPRMGMLF
jgi:hypothetical protein